VVKGALPFLRPSSKLCLAMPFLSGSAAEGEGSGRRTEAPEMAPPAPQKRGRPKGSRNKKTLAALEAVAATTVTPTAAAGVALAPGGERAPSRRGPAARGKEEGATRRRWRPLLRRPAAAGGHRAARTRRPSLPSGPPLLALRGLVRRPRPPVAHRSSGWKNQHSNHQPTSRPRGGPPA
jgi:hypothetical protein